MILSFSFTDVIVKASCHTVSGLKWHMTYVPSSGVNNDGYCHTQNMRVNAAQRPGIVRETTSPKLKNQLGLMRHLNRCICVAWPKNACCPSGINQHLEAAGLTAVRLISLFCVSRMKPQIICKHYDEIRESKRRRWCLLCLFKANMGARKRGNQKQVLFTALSYILSSRRVYLHCPNKRVFVKLTLPLCMCNMQCGAGCISSCASPERVGPSGIYTYLIIYSRNNKDSMSIKGEWV